MFLTEGRLNRVKFFIYSVCWAFGFHWLAYFCVKNFFSIIDKDYHLVYTTFKLSLKLS